MSETARLLDGKAVAADVRRHIAVAAGAMRAAGHAPPGLAVVLVGDDPASRVYVGMKSKACQEAGLVATDVRLPADVSEAELLARLHALDADPTVDGVLVQRPLPPHISLARVTAAIAPAKDVDGFHPEHVGRLALGLPTFVPCTAAGVLRLLDVAGAALDGAEAVVVGRSDIVGRPVATLLTRRNATVTLCHSRTRSLREHVARAEILVVATGRPDTVPGDWVRPGAVVIDVGVNRLADGRLVGDVGAGAAERAAALTPVPGGVGPTTIAFLLWNTLCSAAARRGLPPPSLPAAR